MARLRSYVIHDDRRMRCGRCVQACPTGAISIPQGHAVTTVYGEVGLDQSLCDGCGKCLAACKVRAISKVLRPRL